MPFRFKTRASTTRVVDAGYAEYNDRDVSELTPAELAADEEAQESRRAAMQGDALLRNTLMECIKAGGERQSV